MDKLLNLTPDELLTDLFSSKSNCSLKVCWIYMTLPLSSLTFFFLNVYFLRSVI